MEKIFGKDKGPCLFIITPDGLKIMIDKANLYAHDEISEIIGGGNEVNDLLDACGLLGNNWSEIMPEHIGALTEAPIIGYDLYYGSDAGETNWEVTLAETMWYYPEYQVDNFLEVLLRDGEVTFKKV